MMFERIDVLILCGGLGKRIRRVIPNFPKAMIEMNNKPFLDILVGYVAKFGFRRFIFCVGYKSEIIKEYFRKKSGRFEFVFSNEKRQLGTAGAVKNAEEFIKSDPFLVINGDSFCKLDFYKFMNFHSSKNALISILLLNAKKTDDFGLVKIESNGRIVEFNEKQKRYKGFINAGVYLFKRDVLSLIPRNKKYSLEYDLFPRMVNNNFYGYIADSTLIDIGTPERLKFAERYFHNYE